MTYPSLYGCLAGFSATLRFRYILAYLFILYTVVPRVLRWCFFAGGVCLNAETAKFTNLPPPPELITGSGSLRGVAEPGGAGWSRAGRGGAGATRRATRCGKRKFRNYEPVPGQRPRTRSLERERERERYIGTIVLKKRGIPRGPRVWLCRGASSGSEGN